MYREISLIYFNEKESTQNRFKWTFFVQTSHNILNVLKYVRVYAVAVMTTTDVG